MPRFLIDVNLPYYFSLWRGEEFIHQRDIDDTATDEKIWQYATEKNLIIVTKDSDFSDRMILHTPPPKVIHIRFGNLKMKQFFAVLEKHWSNALLLVEDNKLVALYLDRVEAIG